ncbi:MAG: hypothetical protein ACYTXP_39655 [Nostoc sp.]
MRWRTHPPTLGDALRVRHRSQAPARRIKEPTRCVQPFQDSTPWIVGIAAKIE